MKKDKKCQDSDCCCSKVFTGFEKRVKAKIKDAQKYTKKNPKETKTILASIGAGLVVLFAFFIGKNKNKDVDLD
jgi:hypothetical protein